MAWHFDTEKDVPPTKQVHPWLREEPSLSIGPGLSWLGWGSHYGYDSYTVKNISTATELDPDDYIAFSLEPKPGTTLSLSWLNLPIWCWREEHSIDLELRWSDDDFATWQSIPLLPGNQIGEVPKRSGRLELDADLSAIAGLQDLSGPVSFRLYLYHQLPDTQSVGFGRRDGLADILITGSFAGTPNDLQVQAMPKSHQEIMLSWQKVTGAQWYRILRRADAAAEWGELTTLFEPNAPQIYRDTGLQAETQYHYRIEAGHD